MVEGAVEARWRSLAVGNKPTPAWVTLSLTHPTKDSANPLNLG